MMRRFTLERDTDLSGAGLVAEGVVFSDGTVALRFSTGPHRSTVIWDDIEAVWAAHTEYGKHGRLDIRWLDPEY